MGSADTQEYMTYDSFYVKLRETQTHCSDREQGLLWGGSMARAGGRGHSGSRTLGVEMFTPVIVMMVS